MITTTMTDNDIRSILFFICLSPIGYVSFANEMILFLNIFVVCISRVIVSLSLFPGALVSGFCKCYSSAFLNIGILVNVRSSASLNIGILVNVRS